MREEQPQGTTALQLEQVTCQLGGKTILNDVSLSLERGEIVVVLGPSGAGKSTLLRSIAGFERISSGEIRTPQRVLSSASKVEPPEFRNIGVVVQSFALFPHLTAAQNVGFGLPKDGNGAVVLDWLNRVNLGDRGQSYPHELSGGEQQRVALVRALARQPDIVLLDEAFSSLDQQLRGSVRREAKQLLRDAGATVLAVTHDPEEAMEFADRIVVLSEGEVISDGSPQDLYWRPDSAVAARLLGEVNELRGTAKGGMLETDFGSFDLPSTYPDGATLTVLVRPTAITLTRANSSEHLVSDVRFSGGQSRHVVSGQNGTELSALSGQEFEIGTPVTVEFAPEKIGWSSA